MKPPRVNPAFDKAADNITVWRRLQKQACDEQQRAAYAHLEATHNTQLREHAQKFHDNEVKLMQKETSRLMLEKPDFSLRMMPTQKLRYTRAQSMARQNVSAAHERRTAGPRKEAPRRARRLSPPCRTGARRPAAGRRGFRRKPRNAPPKIRARRTFRPHPRPAPPREPPSATVIRVGASNERHIGGFCPTPRKGAFQKVMSIDALSVAIENSGYSARRLCSILGVFAQRPEKV